MSDLLTARLMASLLEGGLSSTKPLTADEFRALPGKIADLKVGEELRYLGNGSYKIPVKGETIIVASRDVPPCQQKSGTPIRRNDFTSLFKDSDGDICEMALDSQYFERI
jgi:hypothetical protein